MGVCIITFYFRKKNIARGQTGIMGKRALRGEIPSPSTITTFEGGNSFQGSQMPLPPPTKSNLAYCMHYLNIKIHTVQLEMFVGN